MNNRSLDQLDKVLALADSHHEGEAVGAVRMARQILSRDGLSFSDLALAASTQSLHPVLHGQSVSLEAQMQQQITDLQEAIENQITHINFWRRRAMELERTLTRSQSDAERWKKMARETIENLWDTGQAIKADEFMSDAPAPEESQSLPNTSARQ